MKTRLGLMWLLGVMALPLPALAQHDATHEALGRVSFPTSCDPKVQAEFERGVAMLHSYWFGTAGRTFKAILARIPAARWPTGASPSICLATPSRVLRHRRTRRPRGRCSRKRAA